MIGYIKGKVKSIMDDSVIVDVNGIGYEIYLTRSQIEVLKKNEIVEFYTITSMSMYEGIRLYGFRNDEEKAIFELIKSEIPNIGNKKALEYLNKIQKSIVDFKKAVLKSDEKTLRHIFGFTSKTAKKIIDFLKEKIRLDDNEKGELSISYQLYEPALNALVNLGFKASDAKVAILEVIDENRDKKLPIEDIIKIALKKLKA